MKIILDEQDYWCEWPDGSRRKVRVHKINMDTAWILWNEQHEGIEMPVGANITIVSDSVGLTDQVPVNWIKDRVA